MDLIKYIADCVQDTGKKRCSGDILVLDRLALEEAIRQGFQDFAKDAKESTKLIAGVKP